MIFVMIFQRFHFLIYNYSRLSVWLAICVNVFVCYFRMLLRNDSLAVVKVSKCFSIELQSFNEIYFLI